MPKFKLHGGWIGGWNTSGKVEIEGVTIEDACNKFMEGVGDESIETDYRSFDPGDTFVEFAWDADGNKLPVPKEYQEHGRWLEEREKHLGLIEELLGRYLTGLTGCGFQLDRWINHPSVKRPMEALAAVYGPNDLILVRLYQDIWTDRHTPDSYLTLGQFLRANDGFEDEERADILSRLAETGSCVGGGGAMPVWRIEVVR